MTNDDQNGGERRPGTPGNDSGTGGAGAPAPGGQEGGERRSGWRQRRRGRGGSGSGTAEGERRSQAPQPAPGERRSQAPQPAPGERRSQAPRPPRDDRRPDSLPPRSEGDPRRDPGRRGERPQRADGNRRPPSRPQTSGSRGFEGRDSLPPNPLAPAFRDSVAPTFLPEPVDAVEPDATFREPSIPPDNGYERMTDDDLTFLKATEVDEDQLLEDLPERDFEAGDKVVDVIGVKLQPTGPVMLVSTPDFSPALGEMVVAESERGMIMGEVVATATRRSVREDRLPRVIRRASPADLRQRERNLQREAEAFRLCKQRISQLDLEMKLVRVDYLHGGNKAVFFFASEQRVDFRELVRDLARRLHTRVEMRQIGVRDAARALGGIGSCGGQLCCNRFLREFAPVSIRMAKDQNLVLNPQKVSGVCGRLLCCLCYEDEVYRTAARGLPRVGKKVITPDGEGRVKDRDVLRGLVRVDLGGGEFREYPVAEIQPAFRTQTPQGRPNGNAPEEAVEEPSEEAPEETVEERPADLPADEAGDDPIPES